MGRKAKLIFFVTEDWYFCSHRLPLALAAKSAGYDVTVVTRVNEHGNKILSNGLNLINIDISRRSRNPFKEIFVIWRLCKIYRREKPSIVHHVALKPVLYGSVAALLSGVPAMVNALAGLGFLFSTNQKKTKFLRLAVEKAFSLLLGRSNAKVILQNPDDKSLLVNKGILPVNRTVLIRGSGVDLNEFRYTQETIGVIKVILASRMLWDKGVREFVEVARQMKQEFIQADFILVGKGDPENPACIPDAKLEDWEKEGVVQWWGRRNDMPNVLSQSHIVCLPSTYGEGVPKVLIEAAASGRPIVTTNTPGCREIVRDGENGILVPVKNTKALYSAIKSLIESPVLRAEMGVRGREIVEKEFSIRIVTQQTLALYAELLNQP